MMKLIDLGFDPWFEAYVNDMRQEDQGIARVSAVDRNSYIIRNEIREIPAELAGKFYFHVESSVELPCVGDWVTVQYYNDDTLAIIHGVFPRRTFLRRKRAGVEVDYQMIAAIRQAGIMTRVIALSNITGSGFDEFHQVLIPGRTYCLLGSSGVGKTTLINHLTGRDDLDTKAVSGTGEGTHTTARRQLIVLDKGVMFIDTPGMRELGLLGASEGVNKGFEDIIELSMACRYADCSHTRESDCAVLTAITNGELSEERYSSYMKLKKESEYHEMSYVDKRKKDRAFGRFIKSAKKQMK